jgi:hypothetical protein
VFEPGGIKKINQKKIKLTTACSSRHSSYTFDLALTAGSPYRSGALFGVLFLIKSPVQFSRFVNDDAVCVRIGAEDGNFTIIMAEGFTKLLV